MNSGIASDTGADVTPRDPVGSDTQSSLGSRRDVPSTGPKDLAGTKDLAERNEIFSRLVQGDTDIAGLVAYSIYKQNKLDWLAAFESATDRAPDAAELFAYIVGEGTPRRLATYRQLADATLAGEGATEGPRRLGAPSKHLSPTPVLIVTYALIAVLFAVGFWLAAHFTLSR